MPLHSVGSQTRWSSSRNATLTQDVTYRKCCDISNGHATLALDMDKLHKNVFSTVPALLWLERKWEHVRSNPHGAQYNCDLLNGS